MVPELEISHNPFHMMKERSEICNSNITWENTNNKIIQMIYRNNTGKYLKFIHLCRGYQCTYESGNVRGNVSQPNLHFKCHMNYKKLLLNLSVGFNCPKKQTKCDSSLHLYAWHYHSKNASAPLVN
jgi:hypothetical protein